MDIKYVRLEVLLVRGLVLAEFKAGLVLLGRVLGHIGLLWEIEDCTFHGVRRAGAWAAEFLELGLGGDKLGWLFDRGVDASSRRLIDGRVHAIDAFLGTHSGTAGASVTQLEPI